jgi:hypothetical protein
MSNGEKAGRVAQVFGVQLWNKFLSDSSVFAFYLPLFALYRFLYCFSLWG